MYKNAAEKQKAWRIKHGQKRKVSIEIRRGERLGSSESEIRGKKEGETWEEYHTFVARTVTTARMRQAKATGAAGSLEKENDYTYEESVGAKRSYGKTHEPEMSEDYYELRAKYEKDLRELDKRGKIKKKNVRV